MGTRGDKFIKVGFWSQLVLLFLVDWGSLLAFSRYEVPWYHWVGFALVNGALLWMTYVMWKWLKPQQSPKYSHGREPTE